jgi:hypothetical protein
VRGDAQQLQDRTDARAGRIEIAALFERPAEWRHGRHHVSGRRAAFLDDEELDTPCGAGAEAREQPFPGQPELNELGAALERERKSV